MARNANSSQELARALARAEGACVMQSFRASSSRRRRVPIQAVSFVREAEPRDQLDRRVSLKAARGEDQLLLVRALRAREQLGERFAPRRNVDGVVEHVPRRTLIHGALFS